MPETIQYIPVVKSKKNDLAALSDIRPDKKGTIRPLIELAEYGDIDVDDVLEQFTERMTKFRWPHAPYVDLYSLLPDAVVSGGENATTAGYKLLAETGATFIPVYGRARNDELWRELGIVARSVGGRFCFRVDSDDLDDEAEETWQEIVERAAEMGIRPSNLDLVVDLRYVGERQPKQLVDLVVDFLGWRPASFVPREIAVVGSSALRDVSTVPSNGAIAIPRRELHVWGYLVNELAGTADVKFGDYGVIHPDFSQSAPSPNANGKIRYTRGPDIHYFRGSRLHKPPGYAQYYNLARRVVTSTIYLGRSYSAGDERIWACANRACGTGNLSTWVRADQNHHFEVAVEQLNQLRQRIVRASESELEALLSSA